VKRRNFFQNLAAVTAGGFFAPLVDWKKLVTRSPPTYHLTLTSSPVVATAVKLKANWSIEADQNLREMYDIKAERVLVDLLQASQ
jgi:hypothetical protein